MVGITCMTWPQCKALVGRVWEFFVKKKGVIFLSFWSIFLRSTHSADNEPYRSTSKIVPVLLRWLENGWRPRTGTSGHGPWPHVKTDCPRRTNRTVVALEPSIEVPESSYTLASRHCDARSSDSSSLLRFPDICPARQKQQQLRSSYWTVRLGMLVLFAPPLSEY